MTKRIELKPEIKELLDKVFALRRENKDDEAIVLLKQIIEQAPEVPFSYGTLGHIAWERGDLWEANNYFRKVSELIPDSSLASLGVFHTFWQMEQYESALWEIQRFQSVGGRCKDYEDIVTGLINQNIIDENMNLI